MIKKYKYGREASIAMLKGVHTLFRSVSSTFGPLGSVVYLPNEQGYLHPTKDGVTVAKSIGVADQFEEIGAQSVKEVALKTVDRVGDGTTSSVIFIYSFLLSCFGVNLNELKDINDWDEIEAILRSSTEKLTKSEIKEIEKWKEFLVKYLKDLTVDVKDDLEVLVKIARTSANGDEKIVKLIRESLEKIGTDANFIIENSNNIESSIEATEGVYIPVGMTSPFYSTVPGKILCELENPHIILTDSEIVGWSEIKDIVLAILNDPKEKNNKQSEKYRPRPFVIICKDISFVAEGALVTNIKKSGEYFRTCCISLKSLTKGSHYSDSDLFEDLSQVFGGRLISKNQGLELGPLAGKNSAKIHDLGSCERIVVSKSKTIIFPTQDRKEVLVNYVNKIKDIEEKANTVEEKRYHNGRWKRISSGVAIITLGAPNQQSAVEMRDRLDDAICAVQSARENGALPGACSVYLKLEKFINDQGNKPDGKVPDDMATLLGNSFKQMIRSLFHGHKFDDGSPFSSYRFGDDYKDWSGPNLASGESSVNVWDEGIIDSADSIVETISNGLDLAALLLRTETLIVPDLEEMLRLRNLVSATGAHQAIKQG